MAEVRQLSTEIAVEKQKEELQRINSTVTGDQKADESEAMWRLDGWEREAEWARGQNSVGVSQSLHLFEACTRVVSELELGSNATTRDLIELN